MWIEEQKEELVKMTWEQIIKEIKEKINGPGATAEFMFIHPNTQPFRIIKLRIEK